MPSVRDGAFLLVWACLSVATSMSNKWLLARLAFDFPVCLSCAHMAGAAVALNAYLAWRRRQPKATALPGESWKRTTNEEARTKCADTGHASGWAQGPAWWLHNHGRYVVPIAAMFAASVCLRNSAFSGLPLPVMQLLGSCAPLGSYVLSAAVGLAALTLPGLASFAACTLGVAIAISDRLVPFSRLALARHAAGVGLQVCRSIMLQLLIRRVERGGNGGVALEVPTDTSDSRNSRRRRHRDQHLKSILAVTPDRLRAASTTQLKSPTARPEAIPALEAFGQRPSPSPRPAVALPTALLAACSPLCAAMLAIPAAAFELGPALADARHRPPWFWVALAANIAVALALNLAAVTCLHRVGALALSLTGFAKDWGLVVLSTAVFGREVAPRFVAGMLVTTCAVGVYANVRA